MAVRIPITKINRFFNIIFGGLLMIAVAVVCAFTTMRLAIHGGEVEVPNLAGMTVADATHQSSSRGLNLVLISRFYSTTIPAGHIISQTPSPGSIVRHEWEVRAIESLGPQRVSIPDVSGQAERPAGMAIRRLSLDLGTVAHLPAPGDSEIVLAQTPPPNAEGVDSPRVSLLLSQKDDGRATAFVMPNVTGLSLAAASSKIASLGLYVIVAAPQVATPTDGSTPLPAAPSPSPDGIVSSQTPLPAIGPLGAKALRLLSAASTKAS